MENDNLEFSPVGDGHAISALLVVLEFKNEFSAVELSRCLAAYSSDSDLAQIFPRKMKKVRRESLDPSVSKTEALESKGLMGIMFSDGGGAEDGISIRLVENQLKLVFYKYPSWSSVKHKYWKYLVLVAEALNGNPIEFLGMQVVDEFESAANSIYFDKYATILNSESEYLPSVFFKSYGPKKIDINWMSDLRFSNIETILFHRLNIGLLPDRSKSGAVLKLTHQLRVAIPKEAQADVNWDGKLECFDQLFSINKEVLKNTLNDGLAERVGLQ